MIQRLILWVALAGMILALHLWVQKARAFDQGCLGLSKPEQVVAGGCEEVNELPASHLLGISNAAWGYAFYFGLSLLSFAKIIVAPESARRLHRLGEGGVALAAAYSAYLVYAMIAAGAICALCLTSAGFVATLLVLHVILRRRGGFVPVTTEARLGELGWAGAGLFAASGLLVGVLIFVNRLGTRPLDQGSSRRELEALVGQALPIYIDGEKLLEMRACHFDREAAAMALEKYITARTPFLGRADAVAVVMFYDPNCGFCKQEYPLLLKLAARFGDRARFYALPRAIWDYSIPQVAALKLAEPSGKYFELWQRMLERAGQGKAGLTVPEIAALFGELGLDTKDLESRLAGLRQEVLADRAAYRAAGLAGVPSFYIDGRRVWSPNRSEACVGRLLERTVAGKNATPAAVSH